MRRLTLLCLVAAAGAAAFAATRETIARLPQASIAQGERVLPGLASRLGEVAEVTVQQGPAMVRLVKGAKGWRAPDKFDFPVKAETVNQLLSALGELETIEAKTARPDLLPRLDLGDPKADGAKGIAVTLKDGRGTVLADLTWGKRRSAGGAYAPGAKPMYYVRKDGAGRALLVQAGAAVEIKPTITDWLNKEILDIRATRVTKVTFTDPDGQSFALIKDTQEDANFMPADLPEGWQAKESYELNLPAALVDLLAFDDVQPAAKLTDSAKLLRTTTVALDSGVTLAFAHYEADGGPWTRITVAGTPETEAGKAELVKLTALVAPWAYRLPEFKQKRIMTGRDDIMAKPAG